MLVPTHISSDPEINLIINGAMMTGFGPWPMCVAGVPLPADMLPTEIRAMVQQHYGAAAANLVRLSVH
jgi:hypothetical protein